MATYLEIRSLFNSSDLLNKVSTAVIIYAQNISSGTPTTAQKAWIAKAFSTPQKEAQKVLMGVLAANNGFTQAQIIGATDAGIQTQVDLIAPILIDAFSGV